MLGGARSKNRGLEISGMLLHVEGSFLQVIEGKESALDALFTTISADPRHGNIVTIIRESIPRRAFTDWRMGFADITRADIENTEGFTDFLENASAVRSFAPGRAQKLLTAFKDGRWRSKAPRPMPPTEPTAATKETVNPLSEINVAFQPIVSISQRAIWAHEALAWDVRMQRELKPGDRSPELLAEAEETARRRAMMISATPDASRGININVRPTSLEGATAMMKSIIDEISFQKSDGRNVTLELNQDYINEDINSMAMIVQNCKENGLNICLDDFGAGRSALNQIEISQPNSIALNAKLVRDIHSNGAKQAIIRGLVQTCDDLGIDVIAKYVETRDEFHWLAGEGIDLFQGGLIGNSRLDHLPTEFYIPE